MKSVVKLKNRYIQIRQLFIVVTIFLLNISIIHGHDNINFRNITNEDGLSQGTVETMIQDSEGYIWIGTNDGLNRYNGHEIKVYRHNPDQKNTIVNNYIVDLQQDKKGNIWVGTANGLSKINKKDNSITNYIDKENYGNLSNYNIGDILITKSGSVIVGTSNGLNVYNSQEDRFERILEGEQLSSQVIFSLTEDEDENLWIGTKEGVNKVNIKTGKITHFGTDTENKLSDDYIYSIYSDNKGSIWAGTTKKGINKIDIDTNEVTYYTNSTKENSIPGNYIRDFLSDSKGNMWIATNNGLAKYDEEKNEFTTYKRNLSDANSLADNEIFSLIEDNKGLIWVGTYSGISMFDSNDKIEHYKQEPLDENSISENLIHGIYEDEDGLLWVGTNSKGVNLIDREDNKIININRSTTDNLFYDDNINDITGIRNRVFIATNNGLQEIDTKSKQIIRYSQRDGLADNNIRKLYIDSKDNLWIGTSNGINILHLKDNSITDITKELKENGLEDTHYKSIYEDKDGVYWLGYFLDGGLVKLDPKESSIKVYKYDMNNKKSISSNSVRCITEDDKGNLWIGTSYGLNKFDKEKEEFTRYTTESGLSNNIVYGILIYELGNPWMSTNLGISKLNIKKDIFENFGVLDGLQGNEFNGNASFKNSKGEFLFGGTNGLNIFNPEELIKDEGTDKVVFDEFKVKGNSYKDINERVFTHEENFINIKVFLPDFKNMQNIQYYYILEGSGSEWILSESNSINYSDLNPGKYTFKIRGRSHNGILGEENKVSFEIKPPIWATDIAILMYILIIIFIIYMNMNRVKRLDKAVKNRTSELINEMNKNQMLLNKVIQLEKNKNSYLINLSHELRTPLNVIYSTEQLITELNKSKESIGKENLNNYMEVIRRNTKRLLALINNLIDTTRIESGSYNLNIEDNDIVYIVEEATLSLKDYIERKGIELVIDPEMEEKIIKCDAYEIERCIVNLVSNAAKFTPQGGKIEVNLKDLGKKVMITVSDTGIGIEEKYHEAIFDRFNQVIDVNSEVKGGSGLGLTITKHIIQLHNGTIRVQSKVNEGSRFIIIL